jgi:hypothetical protein
MYIIILYTIPLNAMQANLEAVTEYCCPLCSSRIIADAGRKDND